MRRHGKGQADQREILDDCCHVTSASGLSLQGSRYYKSLKKLVYLFRIFPNTSLMLFMIRKVRIVHINLDLFL